MEKTAMQFAIEWVNDNYPKFNHYEIEAKLTELRDTVEKEQTNTLQSENDRLRERVRELEGWFSIDNPPEAFKTVLLDYGGDNGICSGYYQDAETIPSYIPHFKFMSGNTPVAWKRLPIQSTLTKPADSTGGGEKVGRVEDVCRCEQLMRCSIHPDLCAYCGNEFRG